MARILRHGNRSQPIVHTCTECNAKVEFTRSDFSVVNGRLVSRCPSCSTTVDFRSLGKDQNPGVGRIYIDVEMAARMALAANNGTDANMPVGGFKDRNGNYYKLFLNTNRDTKQPVTSEDGLRYAFNWRWDGRDGL